MEDTRIEKGKRGWSSSNFTCFPRTSCPPLDRVESKAFCIISFTLLTDCLQSLKLPHVACLSTFFHYFHTTKQTLGLELCNVNKWPVDNKLSLHLGKTESILCRSITKLSKNQNLYIQCNKTNINLKSTVKYWGVILNNTGSGESAALDVMKKSVFQAKIFAQKIKIPWRRFNEPVGQHWYNDTLINHVSHGTLV